MIALERKYPKKLLLLESLLRRIPRENFEYIHTQKQIKTPITKKGDDY
ncbi:hypothetical protein SAMN05880501_101794 [Ureibacillus xyleni]|uniref:Uncharacterized protein n=1 Tax=Ureibacillus xyleni TaxID=614648 RepID=A0A285RPJ1_9BACL|nr:hypothetical protein SAMN05880501_101794 [Ureibacillus xyleni]